MEGQREFVVDPNARYSDIIVPTLDTVRSNFLVELMATNSKPVSLMPATLYMYMYMYRLYAYMYMYMYMYSMSQKTVNNFAVQYYLSTVPKMY